MRCLAVVCLFLLFCVPCAGAWTWPVQGPVLAPFSFDAAHPYAGGEHRGIATRARTYWRKPITHQATKSVNRPPRM